MSKHQMSFPSQFLGYIVILETQWVLSLKLHVGLYLFFIGEYIIYAPLY